MGQREIFGLSLDSPPREYDNRGKGGIRNEKTEDHFFRVGFDIGGREHRLCGGALRPRPRNRMREVFTAQ